MIGIKKELIFEILCIALIFIIVPFFYKNIDANLFTNNNPFENRKKDSERLFTNFTITAYCPGPCCNGKWAGLTASGKSIDYYTGKGINIIAVDPEIIALGSKIIYQGIEYSAVDTGEKIKGKRLDILFPTHDETEKFGIKKGQTIKITQ